MEGENFVSLKGTIVWPELKVVGEKNSKLFKGKLAAPIAGRSQYIKIAAWGSLAEALSEVGKDEFVHIHGHIEERSYNGHCRHCQAPEKKYWTEVMVDNFTKVT
jgi:hypothetical protein